MKTDARTATAANNGAAATNSGAHMQSAIAREYHALLSDLEHLIGTATSMSSDELAKAKSALGARIDAARSTIGHASDVVIDRAKRSARATDEFVTERPWQSVGIAAAAALAIGYLLGRRGS
jgi:ElaB/YqjD/DUF883 family membrane-anchored ribosome-binding protein